MRWVPPQGLRARHFPLNSGQPPFRDGPPLALPLEHPGGCNAQPGSPGDALSLSRGVDPAKQLGVQAHVDDRLLGGLVDDREG